MKEKKNPQRFSLQFDPSIPEHRIVIDILLNKGRYASHYIANAVLFYENSKSDTLENTVTKVLTKMFGITTAAVSKQTDNEEDGTNELNFNDIAKDLEAFKK